MDLRRRIPERNRVQDLQPKRRKPIPAIVAYRRKLDVRFSNERIARVQMPAYIITQGPSFSYRLQGGSQNDCEDTHDCQIQLFPD